MLRLRKKMTRMQMKMMLSNMSITVTSILKVMSTIVLSFKTFAIGKILSQMSS